MVSKDPGYLGKFLKRADKAIDDGIKKADEVLEDAVEFGVMATSQAKKTSTELQNRAKKEQTNIRKKGVKKINDGILAAKKATSNSDHNLEILEKLGKLRKAGVITEKEFQAKKKKILAKI